MPKTKLILLNGKTYGHQSHFHLSDFDPQITIEQDTTYQEDFIAITDSDGKIGRVAGPNYLEIRNNGFMDVCSNILPLENIRATNGVIEIHNNYYNGPTRASIEIDTGSKVGIYSHQFLYENGRWVSRGETRELPISSVTIDKNAYFSISYKENTYNISTSDTFDRSEFDPYKIIKVVIFLNDKCKDSQKFQVSYDEIHALRVYDTINKEILSMFAQQNSMEYNEKTVEQYKNQNFLACLRVCTGKDLSNSDFQHFSKDIIGEIGKYINLYNDYEYSL